MTEKREPQNTEQGIMNVERKENFSIRHSLFDIRYSNWEKLIGPRILVADIYLLTPETKEIQLFKGFNGLKQPKWPL